MRPPEVSIRIGRVARCHHRARPSVRADADHLDGIQIVRREAELATEEAKSSLIETLVDHGEIARVVGHNHDGFDPLCFSHCRPILVSRRVSP